MNQYFHQSVSSTRIKLSKLQEEYILGRITVPFLFQNSSQADIMCDKLVAISMKKKMH